MKSRAQCRYLAAFILLAALQTSNAAESARKPTPREEHPGITTAYETLTLRDGVKLQTIITRPANAAGRLPAILFVQWLSCNTVADTSRPADGWSAMMRRIVRESNALVWRTEKRGVGSSEGDCATMDYDTELADHREAPAQIAASDATLGSVWTRIVGTASDGQYGRPFTFHQQAQKADWSAAWSRVRAPVLAMYGQYDWFESHDAASLIARIANAKSPGRGTFVEVPGMNHHFEVYPSAEAAFREERGQVNPDSAVDVMLGWLRRILASGRVSGL